MTHEYDNTQAQEMGWADRLEQLRRQMAASSERGMTLIEIMIVLVIMVSIGGTVGFFAIGALEEAQIRQAKVEVSNLDGMIQQHMLMQSPPKLPEQLEQLTQGVNPVTKKIPEDPWGNDYIYRKTGNKTYEIFSAGPDGSEGTEDDIAKDE